jgi:hypothetical protein
MAEETMESEDENGEQIVGDEALTTGRLIEMAREAAEAYVTLASIVTGSMIDWNGFTCGPEIDIWFFGIPNDALSEKEGTYVFDDNEKDKEFVENTKYLRDEIEQLMKRAMVAKSEGVYETRIGHVGEVVASALLLNGDVTLVEGAKLICHYNYA